MPSTRSTAAAARRSRLHGLRRLDRNGRELLSGFAQPAQPRARPAAAARPDRPALRPRGLDGSDDHIGGLRDRLDSRLDDRIDRSRSPSSPRRAAASLLEFALIAAAAAACHLPVGWLFVRARREAERAGARARLRNDLAHALGAATRRRRSRRGLAAALATAFPGRARGRRPRGRRRLGLEVAATGGHGPRERVRASCIAARCAALRSGAAFAIETRRTCASGCPTSTSRCTARVRSLYCRPARRRGRRERRALPGFAERARARRGRAGPVASHAEQAALALDRARSSSASTRSRSASSAACCRRTLPAIDGLDLAGRYQAGSAGIEVGGDWYDVVRRATASCT